MAHSWRHVLVRMKRWDKGVCKEDKAGGGVGDRDNEDIATSQFAYAIFYVRSIPHRPVLFAHSINGANEGLHWLYTPFTLHRPPDISFFVFIFLSPLLCEFPPLFAFYTLLPRMCVLESGFHRSIISLNLPRSF